MKRLLTVAGIVASLTVVPMSAASATTIIDTAACPTGYTGIVVIVNGNSVMVCQNIHP